MGVRLVVHNFAYDIMDYTGTHNHDEMLHRDWRDAHPIYSITGLQEILNTIESNLVSIINTITQKETEIKDYSDTNLQNESDIINDKIDNLNVLDNTINTDTVELNYNNNTLRADVKIYNDLDGTNEIIVTEDGMYSPKFITKNSSSIKWENETYGEELDEMFDYGIRFSHNDTTVYNNIFNSEEAQGWVIDKINKTYTQPLETSSYNGIISKNYYDEYKHSVRISSTSTEAKGNAVVIGYVTDEFGNPHTLSLVVQRNDPQYVNCRIGIIYNYQLPGQTLVYNYNILNANSGWNLYPQGISFYIKKSKNNITVKSTAWGYTNNCTSIEQAANMTFVSNINIDLDDYAWGYLFKTKVRYGYGNISQPDSVFSKMFFHSDATTVPNINIADVKISNETHNVLEKKEDGLYVKEFIVADDQDNALVKKENGYYVKATAMYISDQRLNGLEDTGEGHYYVHKSHSFVEITQDGHGFKIGDFIYYDNRTALYQKAIAKDDFDINIVGMVSYVYNINKFEYICNGYIETDLFTEQKRFVQGMPIYISDTVAGGVTQIQPDISKTVGYPVDNKGIIISIERGIQYGQEANIGDFKQSANNYNVRSDGFIKVAENIDYRLSLVQALVNTLDSEFKETYLVIDQDNNTLNFINTNELYRAQMVSNGLNLFIKAF